MKTRLKTVVKAFSAVALSSCVAIGGSPANSIRGRNVSADGGLNAGVSVWTTYNDYTVLQDPSSMNTGTVVPPTVLSKDENLSLSVTLGKGEREGTQIIITPESNVSSYSLKVNDLTKVGGSGEENEIISAENIDVYKQCYLTELPTYNTLETYYKYVPVGNYPDMLLPLETAIEYKETTIEAGKNQGISIEIESSEKQAAGVYSGTFLLTVDGKTKEIPVTATVRDIDLSTSYFRTSAASGGTLNAETYEMLMDEYRVQCQYPFGGAYSPERMLEQLEKYWDNPHFASYDIPSSSAEKYYKYISVLAEASSPTRNYLSRAACYVQAYDESADVEGCKKAMLQYRAMKEKVMKKVDDFFPGEENAAWREELKQTIRDLPTYLTTDLWHKNITVDMYDCENTWTTFCPYLARPANFDGVMYDLQTNSDQPIWVYANGDFSSGVSQNMPNYGNGMRSIGWFGAKYDIAGNLFWDIDSIRVFSSGNKNGTEYKASRDYYANASSFDGTGSFISSNGDGVYIYPAIKYGDSEGWYGSIRLRNFRDGVEDHALLTELEKVYAEKFGGYGLKNFDEIVNFMYDVVLGGDSSADLNDGSRMLKMRDLLFDLYDLANSDVAFALNGIELNGLQGKAEFFAQADSVTVNGNTLTANGNKYAYDFDIAEGALQIVLEKDGVSYAVEITPTFYTNLVKADLSSFATNIENYATSSSGSIMGDYVPAGTVKVEDDKLVYSIPARGYSMDEADKILGYAPTFTMSSKLFGCDDLYDKYYVQMKIRIKLDDKNQGNQSLLISFEGGSTKVEIKSLLFKKSDETADGWREKTVIFKISRKGAIESVGNLRFNLTDYFNHIYVNGATIEISDIIYTTGKYYND